MTKRVDTNCNNNYMYVILLIMKPSPNDNPLTTLAAANQLGLPRFTILAIKRSMGVSRKYIFASEIRNFMRNNPGWKPTDANRKTSPKSQTPPTLKEAHEPTAVAIKKINSDTQTQPAAVATTRRNNFARMCRMLRKQNKVDVKDLAEKTGFSASCIYKMERTGDVSVSVVKQVGRLICKTDVEFKDVIAQWFRETVGIGFNELRIESLGKDEVLESQMDQIRSVVCSLTPEHRAQIITSISDVKILGLLCNLPTSGRSVSKNSN